MPTEHEKPGKSQPTEAEKVAQAKLKELAGDRVKRAVQAINSVGNLNEFKPTEAQQKAMITVLETAVADAKKALADVTAGPSGFQLPD